MSRIPVAATGAICVAALLAGCSDWSEYNDLRDSPAVTSCVETARGSSIETHVASLERR
ncbi:hypothetical protein [Herbiconiux sp.]|uniref:hypothetical protein n=1 Tax=Herbiconiux sp. TaxID=1871186 RepID=UPI0025BD4006|nr:hypothetical protein [Herbiconiux sp.]